ncbi:hypothetical protein IP76_05485 [Rhizobium sp. AAP43]|nr:hypothetical protein IP76_05485 [Rhizobium sp. AAP43]
MALATLALGFAAWSGQAMAQSASEQAMSKLTAQWYNAVVNGLNLDSSKFQLMQANTAFGTTSDSVWAFFDAMPPQSVSNFYEPSRVNSFAQTYGAVINNLVPQVSNDLQKLLADKYVAWETYASDPKNLPNPLPKDKNGYPDFVQVRVTQYLTWGLMNGLDTNTLNAGRTLLQQTDIISTAITQWVAANGQFAYTASIGDVQNQVNQGRARSASLDSTTTSSDVSQSWAKVAAEGVWDIFGGEAESSWSQFTSSLTNEKVQINATFQKVATVLGGPYATSASTNPDLVNYSPWYNGAALKTAQENNNNIVWKHGAPTWDQTFGGDGNMQRVVQGLIVVDGVTITMTSSYSVAQEDRENVQHEFAAGFFPFFGVEGEGGWSNDVTFNDDGTFTAVSTSPVGNPQILGVLVESINDALSTEIGVDFQMTSAVGGGCAQIPNGVIGQCMLGDGTQLPRTNCPACCAHRTALTWIGGGNAVACQ